MTRGKGYTLVIETVPDQGELLAVAEDILYNRAIRESTLARPEDPDARQESRPVRSEF